LSKKVPAGSWVQIHNIVLTAEERAPQVPEDTGKVPLEMWAKGFLLQEAEIGEQVEIETVIGNKYQGELVDEAPAYDHSFGKAIPELLKIGPELKRMLQDKGGAKDGH